VTMAAAKLRRLETTVCDRLPGGDKKEHGAYREALASRRQGVRDRTLDLCPIRY
jgi:hypothetical protein